jgi:NitT/TauT family transport system substrate-binding protein
MPSDANDSANANADVTGLRRLKLRPGWRIVLLALCWLGGIAWLHHYLNGARGDQKVIRMGYMPVITNLSAPLLDHATRDEDLHFQAIKFASFAEMAEALRNDEIHAAFMIAPLSIVLHQQGAQVRVVYIGNRHESTLVANKKLNITKFQDLKGHTIAVPMRYSGHYLQLLRLMEQTGLTDRIEIVEMNPPDMASALSSGSLDAYFVGEPFAAQTLKIDAADLVLHVEEIQSDFICNLLIVGEGLIDNDRETVQALVQGAARAGLWARDNLTQASQIAARYWNQPRELVEYALNTPKGRIVYDRFVPQEDELQAIADEMVRFGLLKRADIKGLVDDSFAKFSDLDDIDL